VGNALSRTRAVMLVTMAIAAANCGGTPTAPTAPGPASGGSLPVVEGVRASRTHVEAGDEIELTATVSGSATPGQARYLWSVQPNAGVLSPDGLTARWRAPVSDPVPASYVFTVSLVQTSQAAIASPTAATSSAAMAASSTPVFVNDARREMNTQSDAFLHDFADANVAPEMCVRNFTQTCSGRQQALQDITASRETYSALSLNYALQLFVRSIEWENCTAPDGTARCAVLIYDVTGTRTRRADGTQEPVAGTQYVRGFYEQNRWWLCGAEFDGK
jgi:hypothetical protein